jgi:hypothetical protein
MIVHEYITGETFVHLVISAIGFCSVDFVELVFVELVLSSYPVTIIFFSTRLQNFWTNPRTVGQLSVINIECECENTLAVKNGKINGRIQYNEVL